MRRTASVAIALGISLFIYVFYRSEKTVINGLITLILSFEIYIQVKSYIVNAIPLGELVVFSLPGGLWVFCATTLSHGFYVRLRGRTIQVAAIPIVFATGLEFLQLFHLTNGRFDVLDIAAYVFFWSLSCYFFESPAMQQKKLSPFTLPGFICLACILSVYLAHVQQ